MTEKKAAMPSFHGSYSKPISNNNKKTHTKSLILGNDRSFVQHMHLCIYF